MGLASHGPVLTLTLAAGQSVAIVGPAGSGKSRLLRFLSGQEAPPAGQVELHAPASWPQPIRDRKLTPQQLVRAASGQAERASDALAATRLWDHRQSALADLSPGQQHLAELLPLLAHEDRLLIFDGHLDSIDLWALAGIRELLQRRLKEGAAAAIVTNRPDIVEQCDLIVAVANGHVRHAGRVQDLLRKTPHELEVVSEHQPGVRAMARPFTVEVTQKKQTTILRAEEGQQLAAKLLLEGYGDVRYIVHRQPTMEECLLGLV